MDEKQKKKLIKPFAWFALTGLCLVSLFGAPALESNSRHGKAGVFSSQTIDELQRLDILGNLAENDLSELLRYQDTYHVSLPDVFKNPFWVAKMGYSSRKYRATWYISNPFDLLPEGLQAAIQKKSVPIQTRKDLWKWCRINKFSEHWKDALKAALVETTPENLWRAARGREPFAHNGEILEPIVIDHGYGRMEVKEGHIAIDPRIIPLNSKVILVAKINGAVRILKVRAADIGGAVKGYHVDLPIRVHSLARKMPHARLPSEHLRNSTVEILVRTPARGRKTNPNRKV